MNDGLKIILFVAALWGIDKWRDMEEVSHDFWVCHVEALEAIKNPELLALLLPRDLNQHDQIDELLNRCMLAKDYDFVPQGWERCPTEKLPSCYDKPSWLTRIYRAFRDTISAR